MQAFALQRDQLARRVASIASSCCLRRQAIRGRLTYPGGDLPPKPRDANHVELVEVRAEDREELEPLEQRIALVERFVAELER